MIERKTETLNNDGRLVSSLINTKLIDSETINPLTDIRNSTMLAPYLKNRVAKQKNKRKKFTMKEAKEWVKNMNKNITGELEEN